MVACKKDPPTETHLQVSASVPSAVAEFDAKSYPLASLQGRTVDLTYDRATHQVWMPLGALGKVAVFATATGAFTEIDGFKIVKTWNGAKPQGPSAVATGDGVAYVANRAAGEVCVVSEATLKLGACLHIPSAPDVLVYVSALKELWVTTPGEESITVLDASNPDTLVAKTVIKAGGAAEESALDAVHGIFYTKLAAKNRVFAFDVKQRSPVRSWPLGCNDTIGSRTIAVDGARSFVFVGCVNVGLEVYDGAHDGALVGKVETGRGVFGGMAYVEATKRLYVAAAWAHRLSTIELSDHGVPTVVATTTIPDANGGVVADATSAYVVDPETARLLVFASPHP